jgi:hypothetical protein
MWRDMFMEMSKKTGYCLPRCDAVYSSRSLLNFLRKLVSPSSHQNSWKHKKLQAATICNISKIDWWIMHFRIVEQSLCLIKHRVMKVCEGTEVQLHAFLISAVSFKPLPIYSMRKSPRCPSDMRLIGPQCQSVQNGEEKILCPCRGWSPLSSKKLSHYIYCSISTFHKAIGFSHNQ